ncbi:MAG: putative rane protein [Ilumatobacteraceae bacterium]|nr:putative rane protein [Ilumatobacteraceae bacterium]
MSALLRTWRAPLGIFCLLMLMLTTWTVGMPLFTSPDEAAHLYKAYGTAHFEALGDIQPGQSTNIRVFDVPQIMGTPASADHGLGCYFFKPDVSAACASGHDGVMASTAAVYPPFWYAVVGGATRIVGESTHQRAYRAISALLCAALIAAAFESARRSRQRSLSPLLLIGLTPMTVFLAGTLNPNGFEIAGFILAWSLCLHLDRPRAASARAGFIVGALVSAMLLSRFASVVWVASGAVIAAVLLGWTGMRRLGRRFFVPAIGCSVAAVVALAAWSKYAGVSADDPRPAVDWTRGHVIRETVHRLPGMTKQMIGVLGWVDTPLPWVVHLMFALLTLIVLVGVVVSRDRRLMLVTALVALALFAAPIAINVISAPTAGLIWQGRYSMPMFAALGFIGMLAWRTVLDRGPSAEIEVVVRYVACAAFLIAEVVAFWQALRRYTVGSHGKIWLTDPLPWQPDVAPMVLIAVNAIAATALCAAILRSTSPAPDAALPTGYIDRP